MRQKEILIQVFKYLRGGYMEDEDELFSMAAGDKAQINGAELQQRNLGWLFGRSFSL